MSNINCIIIEDEFPAMEILKSYLNEIADWTIKAEFSNAIDAIAYLSNNKIDVIFLDIQLPKLSGINFIKTLENPPIIIITSAYNEHAVEAFELIVFDYLLKPYPFERFIKTINRVNKHLSSSAFDSSEPKDEYIIIKENRETVKLFINRIYYIESQKK